MEWSYCNHNKVDSSETEKNKTNNNKKRIVYYIIIIFIFYTENMSYFYLFLVTLNICNNQSSSHQLLCILSYILHSLKY